VALSLRNPETQAKLSTWLVLSSVVMLVMAFIAAMVRKGWSWEERSFVYASTSWRPPMVLGAAAISLVLAGAAFWFAYASADERRNSRSKMSWICFAASAVLIVLGCLFVAAYRWAAFVVRPM
jgi:uncharacterized membrane protein YidH (DUF202 family)